jgi:hypothetical protein
VAIAMWISTLVVVINGLHHLRPPMALDNVTGPAFSLVRTAALASAYYLAVAAVILLITSIWPDNRLSVRLARSAARYVPQLIVAAAVSVTSAPSASASTAVETPTPVMRALDTAELDDAIAATNELSSVTSGGPAHSRASAPATGDAVADSEPKRHVVQPGENLWVIAQVHLLQTYGAEPDERTLTDYWLELTEANRSTLAEPAVPDLILPGQELTLPDPG